MQSALWVPSRTGTWVNHCSFAAIYVLVLYFCSITRYYVYVMCIFISFQWDKYQFQYRLMQFHLKFEIWNCISRCWNWYLFHWIEKKYSTPCTRNIFQIILLFEKYSRISMQLILGTGKQEYTCPYWIC